MYARPGYRYRRYYRARWGHGMSAWQKIALGALGAAVLSGGAGKALHAAGASTTASPGSQAQSAIAFARAQIGKPYIWGGTGPGGFDCSGLVMMAYASAGVTIPRTSELQWAGLRHVSGPHKGDLVFFAGSDGTVTSPGHVGLVLGAHKMIEAYAAGYPVRISTFGLPSSPEGDTDPVGFARPVPLAHITLDSASSYTPSSWARAFLHGAGFARTRCNTAAVTAWERAEGGNWVNKARFNPLNDKRPEPGSSPAVGQVQAYTSWAQGLHATAATLGGPDYGGIRAALRAGSSAQAVASAVAPSPWGTAPFSASC